MSRLLSRLTALLPTRRSLRSPNQDSTQDGSPAAQSDPSSSALSPIRQRQAYLNSLIANCRPISIANLQFSGNGPAGSIFLLDQLYVPPDTGEPRQVKDSDSEADTAQVVSAVAVVAAGQRVVILGAPGSGKSSLLCFLALQHARALSSAEMDIHALLPDWPGDPLLPVLIPVSAVAERLKPPSSPVADEIDAYLRGEENSRFYAPHLFQEADRIGGLFLFDGLDEISDPCLAEKIIQIIQTFAARHQANPATRFVVTCRCLSYTDPGWRLNGWIEYRLAPFNETKIRQFVDAWYGEMIRLDQPRRTYHEIKRANLLSYFRAGDPNRLLELAANPSILTALTSIHASQGGLPDNRVDIYQKCFQWLFTNWMDEACRAFARSQPDRLQDFTQIPPEVLERAFQEIAYQAHANQPELVSDLYRTGAPIAEELIREVLLSHLGSTKKVDAALSFARQPNGILAVQGVTRQPPTSADPGPLPVYGYSYSFLHPTLQVYLAALHLAHKTDLGFEARQLLSRGSRWREVLLLLSEYICQGEASFQRMDSLLSALAPAPLPQEGLSHDGWRAVWLAGEMLPIYRRAFPQRDQEHKHIPRGLVNLLQARGSSLPAHERAAAGDALDLVGDPRFRPDAWYLPDEALFGFLLIPAGPFYMGSTLAQDPAAREPELPQHTLSLPNYFIARNLVTVAQFKAFVEASGYPPTNTVSLQGRLSRPVVYVSWHDARHYCEWLTGQLKDMAARRVQQWTTNETERTFWDGLAGGNLTVTLPSEAEWEKAARGPLPDPDEQTTGQLRCAIYPWGNAFDPNKANTAETGLGTTSPVGCFPMGASPYGVLDMAGNVWEWTRTVWGPVFAQSDFTYPYIPSVERENLEAPDTMLRVIRGGSFFYHNWHTRTSSRGRSTPPEWDWDIGFRVVVSAFRSASQAA